MASFCFKVNFLLYTSWIDPHMRCGNAANCGTWLIRRGPEQMTRMQFLMRCNIWELYTGTPQSLDCVCPNYGSMKWEGVSKCSGSPYLESGQLPYCLFLCSLQIPGFICTSAKQDLKVVPCNQRPESESLDTNLSACQGRVPLCLVSQAISIQHLVHMTGT